MWLALGEFIEPVASHSFVTGFSSSQEESCLAPSEPPQVSMLPSGSRVEVWKALLVIRGLPLGQERLPAADRKTGMNMVPEPEGRKFITPLRQSAAGVASQLRPPAITVSAAGVSRAVWLKAGSNIAGDSSLSDRSAHLLTSGE